MTVHITNDINTKTLKREEDHNSLIGSWGSSSSTTPLTLYTITNLTMNDVPAILAHITTLMRYRNQLWKPAKQLQEYSKYRKRIQINRLMFGLDMKTVGKRLLKKH